MIVPQQPPKEEANNKESNPECKAESSNLSRPHGFEFMKKSSFPSSKCSTSFARFRKKGIKCVSLIHELNQIIDVGNSLGYDVRGCKRTLNKMINGIGIHMVISMARGYSGGLISIWDPNFFSKESIWCDDSFIIIKGNWKNVVGDCYMVNIYGSQDQDDEQGLVDLHIGGRCFTWMNKAGTKLSKLDRFLLSEDVIDLLPDIRITALDRIWSDHNPILLHVDKIDFGPSPFKLYNSWLLRDGFDDLIKSEWDSLDSNNSGFPIKCHEKFCILKAKIRQWNNNNKTMERNRKAAALEELSSIEKKIDEGSASPSDTENRLNLLHELEIIDKFASMDLIQKAQVKWDIEGDENTKFFHGLINQKRRNQMINGIMVEGNWITDPSLIKDAFFQFYKVKFQAKDTRLVTQEEIKEAIWDCGSSKAPGPDRFSFAFVKNIGTSLRRTCTISLIPSSPHVICLMELTPPSSPSFLNWNYLDHILDSLGFGLKWRSWIKTCLSSSRASILVNGSPTSEFSINRGLRQGDPLSPFLFILVMEGLHNAFADAVDDVIITTGWNARDLENIIRVLHVFYLASGLKINIHKSNIYGIGVNEDEVYNMASNAGCIAGFLGIYYPLNFLSPEWFLMIWIRNSGFYVLLGRLINDGKKNVMRLGQVVYYLNSYDNGGLNNWWFDNNGDSFEGIHGLTVLGLSNFLHSKDQYRCSKSYFFRDMLNEIGQLNIVASEDTCVWNLGPNGTFTVKDARNIIDQKTLPSLPSTYMGSISFPQGWCEIPFVQALSFEAFKDWLSYWHAPKEKKHMFFIISTSRQFDFILDRLTEVPSNDRVFGQWLNALFQKAAFFSRLLPWGLFGVSSKTTSK
ncbi:RNA-directed DNA polymerase, eukaryota, reverse transcriptase zinc-binding domain protein [Tanacetum coccineum]|uniref:RNA-directed DNA polymerase, eukaryota, reverse transcriptase zinc-binding domain protein n=1 Tax=Tanacetum coccineum TaxID=301880 RepID=A0ABQ5D7U0_9ASTR